MSETTYSIEPAKSNRAKCKSCKEQILKEELKIMVSAPAKEDSGYSVSNSHHLLCFKIPRKLHQGGNTCGPEEFVEDYLEDHSPNHDLFTGDGEKKDEIIQKLKEAQNKTKKKKKVESSGDGDVNDIMTRLKVAHKEGKTGEDDNDDEEPASKKAKLKSTSEEEEFNQMLSLYHKYAKMTVGGLKDFLKWNGQIQGGVKNFVLFKVIDGELHGRLSQCPLCQGNLKFVEDDYDKIHCRGAYNEDIGRLIPCSYKAPRLENKDVHRVFPWYTEEPSEEEKDEMLRIKEEKKEGVGVMKNEDNPVAQELFQQAESLGIDLSTGAGKKKAAADFVALVDGKVDIPNNRNAKMEIGKLVMVNNEKTPKEIMEAIIEKYGFADVKEEKKSSMEAAAEAACGNPANAGLILAFKQCSKYYFDEGNRNAGSSYVKAIATLTELKEEITAANAMSFSKGKTKLPGIGNATAGRMLEYANTGTFAKLEEKKAAHS